MHPISGHIETLFSVELPVYMYVSSFNGHYRFTFHSELCNCKGFITNYRKTKLHVTHLFPTSKTCHRSRFPPFRALCLFCMFPSAQSRSILHVLHRGIEPRPLQQSTQQNKDTHSQNSNRIFYIFSSIYGFYGSDCLR